MTEVAAGRVALHPAVRWRVWDDSAIVFHAEAGATHHLFGFDAWLLTRIAQAPVSVEELAEAASEVVAAEASGQVAQAVERSLASFRSLRLLDVAG